MLPCFRMQCRAPSSSATLRLSPQRVFSISISLQQLKCARRREGGAAVPGTGLHAGKKRHWWSSFFRVSHFPQLNNSKYSTCEERSSGTVVLHPPSMLQIHQEPDREIHCPALTGEYCTIFRRERPKKLQHHARCTHSFTNRVRQRRRRGH